MKTVAVVAACLLMVSAAWGGESIEWKFPLDVPGSSVTLFPNETTPTGVVVTAGNRVIRLNGDGSVAWSVDEVNGDNQPLPIATPATVADIDRDGLSEILFATADGSVFCLDETSKLKWVHAFNTPAGGFKMVVAADLTPHPGLEILAGFDDGWLNCLNAQGTLLWRFYGDKFRVGGPAVACIDNDDLPEIMFGTDNGHIYCLDTFGRVLWRHSELAPYGRSGVNLAGLRPGKETQLLVTRSNVGNATCLMALDGETGKDLWRTQDVMQSYVSIATVDFEGDGVFEVLHGDKGNNLYCDNADGSRRWQVELGGRGLFWAPCVADVDGDGQLEVIAGVRGADPKKQTCVYVVGAGGKIKSSLKLGNDANASPAVGDIDGDGELEVIVVTQGPNQVQALTWHAAGRVAWPSMRGNSRMTACGNLPEYPVNVPGKVSAPHALEDLRNVGDLRIDSGEAGWGDNTWQISWDDPVPENSFIEARVILAGFSDETRVTDLKAGATSARIPMYFGTRAQADISIHLHTTSSTVPALVAIRQMTPELPDFCHRDQVLKACEDAVAAAAEVHADAGPLQTRSAMMCAEKDALRAYADAGGSPQEVATRATQLRKNADALGALAAMLEGLWRGKDTGSFVWWQDPNPWGTFDTKKVPAKLDMAAPVHVAAYGNEFEDVSLVLRNIELEPMDVRCSFTDPGKADPRPRDSELAKHVTLRRAVPVTATVSEHVWDALPELDDSRAITLPSNEARPLWLVIDTHGLKPGTHELTLYLTSLARPVTVRAVPIQIEVWPVELPQDVYAKMNWASFNPNETSKQTVHDMIDHGVSVIYGPPLPQVPVDASGALSGEVNWAEFDRTLARVPAYFTLMWGGPPSCKWPGAAPAEDSAESAAGFKTAIQELATHMAAKGFDYRQWAFYPIDEPWNTGFTSIPDLKRFCQRVKKADPKAQVYADPAGLVRVEYLDEFKDLIDIWQPEMNLLKRDPKLVEWFAKHAKRFWAYEAPGPAKDLLPLGHYRAFAWLAQKFGTEGAGYWVYRGEDNWQNCATTDYSAVYQTNDHVVPSRRWEADRDGVEDYRACYLLRKEIEKARASHRKSEANEAQALLDEAIEKIVGWQVGSIDEITRWTRDYEIDFDALMAYRTRIEQAIVKLRGK